MDRAIKNEETKQGDFPLCMLYKGVNRDPGFKNHGKIITLDQKVSSKSQ